LKDVNALPYILADSDVNWPKIIFGIIFVIIWGISALVSWINKLQQEAKRRQVREQLERSAGRMPQQQQRQQPRQPVRIAEGLAQRFPDVLLPPAPMPPPPLPQQRRPMPPPRLPVPPKPVRRAPKQPRRAMPVPAAEPVLEEDVPLTPMAPQSPIVSPTRAARPAVDAQALATWLRPATLQKQFMLTEILQPPLALRDPTERA
jgi:hypothetical protein